MSTRWKILLATALVLAVVIWVVLRIGSSEAWRQFRWEDFWQSFRGLRPGYFLGSAALIFSSYWFRCFRWREFLRPMKAAGLRNLLVATLVGFSAVSLLGRPGEIVRPWLIARKEDLAVSSQLAAWALERVFDSLTVAGLLGLALYFPSTQLTLEEGPEQLLPHFHSAGLVLLAGAVVMGVVVSQFRQRRQLVLSVLAWLSRPLPDTVRTHLNRIAESFAAGLAGIENIGSLLRCAAFSALVWLSILAAYWSMLQALGGTLARLDWSAVILVMAATVVGSVAHLPGVGGGQQVAVTLTLTQLFGVPLALATSAAILLWAVTFMMVLIPGLPLTAREGLTWERLRRVTREGYDPSSST